MRGERIINTYEESHIQCVAHSHVEHGGARLAAVSRCTGAIFRGDTSDEARHQKQESPAEVFAHSIPARRPSGASVRAEHVAFFVRAGRGSRRGGPGRRGVCGLQWKCNPDDRPGRLWIHMVGLLGRQWCG
ncbi:hypothetical protein CN934_19000 [Ensifer sp. MMN_5]|nr:hypothetical protein CN934_19000 [Ensifer sp. MMN_5]PND23991.1 hypothetical protein CN933_30070 [Sinorhizobium sp. M4_45]